MTSERKTMMVGGAAHQFITDLARECRLSTVVVSDILVEHVDRGALKTALGRASRAKKQKRIDRRERRAEAGKLADALTLKQMRALERPEILDAVLSLLEGSK